MKQYYDIRTYKQYDRDVKLAVRRGLDMQQLLTVVDILRKDEPLPPKYRNHLLAGFMTAVERPWHSLAISLLGTCVYPLLFLAVLVPLWGLDGVWIHHVVAGVFSAVTAILIVRRVRLQAPPSAPPVASFYQPTISLDFIRPFLAMPKLKQVWLWSSGLTKTFNYRRKAHI